MAKEKGKEKATQTEKPKVRRDRSRAQHLYQLRIELQETEPPVWRSVLVESDMTLWELHENIQVAMGWMNSHMMAFTQGERSFGRPDWDEFGEDLEDARKVKLYQLLKEPGDKIEYEYDFGDSWTHDVVLEKIVDLDEVKLYLPRCIAGENACPPEDCGGVYGFKELKRVIADPQDPRHEDMLKWLDEEYPGYDPREFSKVDVNRILTSGASDYWKMLAEG